MDSPLTLSNDTVVASVLPWRGALTSRLSIGGHELLFLDEATVADPTKNVRGGIPVLFPIAGKLPDGRYQLDEKDFTLAQHGFARTQAWEVKEAWPTRARLGLVDTEASFLAFPRAFSFELAFSLGRRSFRIDAAVTNTGDRALPLHLGFHPYFFVPQAQKARAHVPTQARWAYNQRTGKTEPLSPIDFGRDEVDMHLLDHGSTQAELHRGSLPTVSLKYGPAFSTLVLWTLPAKDFVCVEPWTAPTGAMASGQGLVQVAPGARFSTFLEVSA